uniref:SFI1 n=1 Tax=Chelonoidis abingdonii TaxID=106734 RepID=A0A8C0J1Z6_CHEAB
RKATNLCLSSRHLARKFLYLWVKKTFGQVLPSKARCHYDRKILQKTFGEWKEEWWIVCREWKLSIRADCHYRYFLYNLMFQAWKTFICQRREKRSKYHVAEAHAEKQKLRWTWQHWLIYIDVRRTKHRMGSEALAFRETSTLRVSWRVWTRRLRQNHTGREMNTLALQHWAQSLQFRAWLQWMELYLHIQHDKQKEAWAMNHHQHWELKRCMKAWLRHLQLQREKKHQDRAQLLGDFLGRHEASRRKPGRKMSCASMEADTTLVGHADDGRSCTLVLGRQLYGGWSTVRL